MLHEGHLSPVLALPTSPSEESATSVAHGLWTLRARMLRRSCDQGLGELRGQILK
jgi:hypothetical protein